jgi:hypothetical protein
MHQQKTAQKIPTQQNTKMLTAKIHPIYKSPQTVQKLGKIPKKQEKNQFSPSVYTKNTKNHSFRTVSPTKIQSQTLQKRYYSAKVYNVTFHP